MKLNWINIILILIGLFIAYQISFSTFNISEEAGKLKV